MLYQEYNIFITLANIYMYKLFHKILKFKTFFFNRRKLSLEERNFYLRYLKDEGKHHEYSKNSYVVLENCISKINLKSGNKIYDI